MADIDSSFLLHGEVPRLLNEMSVGNATNMRRTFFGHGKTFTNHPGYKPDSGHDDHFLTMNRFRSLMRREKPWVFPGFSICMRIIRFGIHFLLN